MYTVPFTLSGVLGGFGDGDGLLHNEGTHLCLEYQVKDGLVGLLKSDVKQLRIPVDHVDSVSLTKGWFGTSWGVKIVIQGNRMDTFESFPGADRGRVELSIAGKHLDAAEELVFRFHQGD